MPNAIQCGRRLAVLGGAVLPWKTGAGAAARNLSPAQDTRSQGDDEPDSPQSATTEGPGLAREDQTTSISRLRRLETFSHAEHL